MQARMIGAEAKDISTDQHRGRFTGRINRSTIAWFVVSISILAIATIALSQRASIAPSQVAAPAAVISSAVEPLPNGLTDYQGLFTHPSNRVNHAEVPRGLTDYQGLYTVEPAQPNYAPLPNGLTDYQGLYTLQPAQPNYEPLLRGLTDYLDLMK
jgi:hypothetical protein